MKEFKDKTAVITGAASGIGRAIAELCAREKMKVVLADIEEEALSQAEKEMKAAGASVLAVATDVSRGSDVETLAQKTLDTFGAVHLLCNNAGVGVGGCVWECTLEMGPGRKSVGRNSRHQGFRPHHARSRHRVSHSKHGLRSGDGIQSAFRYL
jgi:NAD(P)-dependent dehydrogenase (short-subunit alcohol dehydrogenase family)